MTKEVEWIKITTNMFDNSKIKQLRTLPAGNDVVLIWVMLLTMAGKCNAGGMIILTENVPYTVEMLAEELKFETSTVIMALEWLERFNMICRDSDCFIIRNWYDYQNEDGLEKTRSQTRDRVAKYREKKKIECNVTSNVTSNVTVTQSSYYYYIYNTIKDIIDYFNSKCNTKYTYKNKSYNKHINARLEEGFTIDDFKKVIDKKWEEWHGNEMSKYLTPDTLFAASKFEKYLNQKEVVNGTDNRLQQQDSVPDYSHYFDKFKQ